MKEDIDYKRPLKNVPFCPISVLVSDFTRSGAYACAILGILACMRACPVGLEDRTGRFKSLPALNLNKIKHFSKVSVI